jgi:signal transduction histidine kinase
MLSACGFFENVPAAEIVLPISTLLYLVLFRDGSVLKKIFWVLISYAIVFALAFFAIAVIAMNMGISSADAIKLNSIELLLTMVLAKSSQAVIFYILSKRKKDSESNGFLSAAPMLTCLAVPLLSIVLIFFINNLIHNEPGALDKLVFAVSVSYLAINVLVFVLYEFITKEAEKNYLLMAQSKQQELMGRHGIQVMEAYEKMREWKHNFKGHMQAVSGMLEKTDPSGNGEAVNYIKGLDGAIESLSLDIVTGNLVFDAIVSAKATLALANNIKFEYDIALQEGEITVNDMDLCSILSNLLDNAVEACRKLDEGRYIDFEAFVSQNRLDIKVTNASGGEYKMERGKLKTTKNGDLHGIGMEHMRSTVKKYGGIFNYAPEPKKFTAHATIPLLPRDFSK